MNLSDLLREERLKQIPPDTTQAGECLRVAERDLKVAKGYSEIDYDWAFNIAYNSILGSIRALMFVDGYKAAGENHHKTIVDYADVKFGVKLHDMVGLLDSMRKKRHRAVYEKAGIISKFEAEQAIKTAQEFLAKVKEKMKK